MKTVHVLLLALLTTPCLTVLPQSVPPLVNYQGRLTDERGHPLPDGNYELAFRIFGNPVPGTEATIWGQQYEVTLLGGVFNVVLGAPGGAPVVEETSVNDLTFAFMEPSRYLELRIVRDHAGTELNRTILPRQQLISTPYALAVPFQPSVGNIIMHHTYSGILPLPRGWMPCDGSVLDQASYERVHGEGSFHQDSIETSPLYQRRTPDMSDAYTVGAARTEWDGTGSTPYVGNTKHAVNLRHNHPHHHQWLAVSTATAILNYSYVAWNARGGRVTLSRGAPNIGIRIVADTKDNGVIGNYYTSAAQHNPEYQLSANQSIQPQSVQVLYIIRVR